MVADASSGAFAGSVIDADGTGATVLDADAAGATVADVAGKLELSGASSNSMSCCMRRQCL